MLFYRRPGVLRIDPDALGRSVCQGIRCSVSGITGTCPQPPRGNHTMSSVAGVLALRFAAPLCCRGGCDETRVLLQFRHGRVEHFGFPVGFSTGRICACAILLLKILPSSVIGNADVFRILRRALRGERD